MKQRNCTSADLHKLPETEANARHATVSGRSSNANAFLHHRDDEGEYKQTGDVA